MVERRLGEPGDVVAIGGKGEALVGECKWGTAGWSDLTRLRNTAQILARELGEDRRLHLALFSGRQTSDQRLLEEIRAGRLLYYTLEDLFGAESA